MFGNQQVYSIAKFDNFPHIPAGLHVPRQASIDPHVLARDIGCSL